MGFKAESGSMVMERKRARTAVGGHLTDGLNSSQCYTSLALGLSQDLGMAMIKFTPKRAGAVFPPAPGKQKEAVPISEKVSASMLMFKTRKLSYPRRAIISST